MRIVCIPVFIIAVLIASKVTAQDKCNNPEFQETVERYLKDKVPTITTDELYDNWDQYIILDAREPEEYEVSHIPGAILIGYDDPDYTIMEDIAKHKDIVIYCSIGYRSEQIGKKLSDKGYNVQNLYGSIFEWANDDYPLEKSPEETTNEVHGYNKSWSKWIENDNIIKVYE